MGKFTNQVEQALRRLLGLVTFVADGLQKIVYLVEEHNSPGGSFIFNWRFLLVISAHNNSSCVE